MLYLLAKSLKNTFFQILKKPGQLILTIIIFIAIAGSILSTFFITMPAADEYADIAMLKGIFFLFMLMFYAISIQKGLSNGDVIFDMQDVNFLFVSPISPKKILLYGLIKMTKTAFWAGFFILFQGTNLKSLFGIEFSGILILFGYFIFSLIIFNLLSLLIYSVTNGSKPKKRIALALSVSVFVPVIVYTAVQYLKTGQILDAAFSAMNSPVFSFTPVAGWISECVYAALTNDMTKTIVFLGVSIASIALLVAYIMFSKADYYEDVLVATETTFEKRRALTEGQVNAAGMKSNRKIKIKESNLGGSGASVLFYKHIRESLRTNPLGVLDWFSVIFIAAAAAVAVALRENFDLTLILQVLMWTQLFMIGTGKGLKELYMHYIYMIPESSFKKIVYSNLEPVLKILIESIFVFGIPGIITKQNPIIIVLCAATYVMFCFMLIAINYLSMRATGVQINSGILIMIYIFAVMLIIAPGLVPAMIVGFSIGGVTGFAVGLLILSAWELAAALICFALSTGVLHKCDIQSLTPNKK